MGYLQPTDFQLTKTTEHVELSNKKKKKNPKQKNPLKFHLTASGRQKNSYLTSQETGQVSALQILTYIIISPEAQRKNKKL